jgi:catalase
MGQGAVARFVAVKLGKVQTANGDALDVEISMETAPAVVWDAMVVPDGEASVETLSKRGHALEFLKDQYRHCKPILLVGAAQSLLDAAGIPPQLSSGAPDAGLLLFDADALDAAVPAFVDALTKHRHFERESDPPRV